MFAPSEPLPAFWATLGYGPAHKKCGPRIKNIWWVLMAILVGFEVSGELIEDCFGLLFLRTGEIILCTFPSAERWLS